MSDLVHLNTRRLHWVIVSKLLAWCAHPDPYAQTMCRRSSNCVVVCRCSKLGPVSDASMPDRVLLGLLVAP